MKHLLVAFACAAAASCGSCLDLREGRPYPCEMDSGLPNECPDQWRCGLELSGQPRCHALGKPGPFVCASDEACEGWHCGVAGVCYDRADAGAMACRADAGDCADGWRCGRENMCRRLGTPGAFQCETSTSALDCAPGWRCNARAKTCQDRDAGAPYACFTDDECEQQWRCGLTDLCVDATSETLRPVSAGLVASRVSPPWTTVEHFAGGARQTDAAMTTHQSYAVTSAGVLHRLELASRGPTFVTHQTTAVSAGVTGLAAVQGRAYVATAAGVQRMTGTVLEPFAPLANARLQTSYDDPPLVAAWAGRDVFTASTAADAGLTVTLPASVLSVAFPGFAGQPGAMWTATDAGLFVGTAPTPLALPPLRSGCSASGGDLALRVLTANVGGGLIAEVQPADGGSTALDFFSGGTVPTATPCTAQGYTFVAQCPVCPPGAKASVAFANVTASSMIRVQCDGPGAARRFADVNVATCSAGLSLQTFALFGNEGSGTAAGISPRGAIEDDQRVTPGGASLAVGTAADVRLFDPRGDQPDTHFLVEGAVAGQHTLDTLAQVCASVPGRPWAIGTRADQGPLMPDRGLYLFPLTRTSAAIAAPAVSFDGTGAYGFFWGGAGAPAVLPQSCFEDGAPIFHAATGATRDGGEVLVVGGEDRLWAIETSRFGTDGGTPPRAAVRTVPAVAGRFQSVAMVDAPKLGGTDYAVGYGLVSQRLFRIRARTAVSWLSEELTLPEGEPLELWADGPNARVGYADGRVFSAASRVQLAPATPAPVRAFASVCGEGFALTVDALYRLVPSDGGAIGVWAPVDLAPANLPSLLGARVYGTDQTLVLTTPDGTVGKVAVPSCQ